jgi:hypothetical protein
MYTHVSKCKKNKILKSEKNKINLSYIKKWNKETGQGRGEWVSEDEKVYYEDVWGDRASRGSK